MMWKSKSNRKYHEIKEKKARAIGLFNGRLHMLLRACNGAVRRRRFGKKATICLVHIAFFMPAPVRGNFIAVTTSAEAVALAEEAGKDRPSVQVIIAALNEEEGIGPTIAELKQFLAGPRILVADGKSCDRTVDVAKYMGAQVIGQEGEGKGDAVGSAIRHINVDADYVVLTDADYTYPASYLPTMVTLLERNPQVGMVCGNRFSEHLNLGALHDLFYIGNRLLAFSHNFFNGVKLTDPLTGLRTVRAQLLRGWKPKSRGFDVEVELNHYIEKQGYDIIEIPIVYRERLGEKKLKIKHGATILKRIMLEAMY